MLPAVVHLCAKSKSTGKRMASKISNEVETRDTARGFYSNSADDFHPLAPNTSAAFLQGSLSLCCLLGWTP